MPKYSKLIKEARNISAARGHRPGKFLLTEIKTGNPPIATREFMVAISESLPGVTEIWGEALGNTCPAKVLAEYQGNEDTND